MKNLFKQSATDVPEWMPEWVKNHPEIKEVDTLSNIPKDIPIEDFKQDLTDDEVKELGLYSEYMLSDVETHFFNYLKQLINKAFDVIRKSVGLDNFTRFSPEYFLILDLLGNYDNQIELVKTIKNCKISNDINKTIKTKIKTKTGEEKEVTKTINIPAGTSLIKTAKIIEKVCETYAHPNSKIIKLDPTGSAEFAMYSKRGMEKYTYSVVFSTKPQDILAMSSRGLFTSCQNLFGDRNYNEKAIYSAISRYAGIIYLTNNQDYKGRGEQIVARAAVFFVVSTDGNKIPHIGLSKIYKSAGNEYDLKDLFSTILQEESPLPVVNLMESRVNYEFPYEGRDMTPYFDPGALYMNKKEENYTEKYYDYLDSLSEEDKKSHYKQDHSLYDLSVNINGIEGGIARSIERSLPGKNSIFYKKITNLSNIFNNKQFVNKMLSRYIKRRQESFEDNRTKSEIISEFNKQLQKIKTSDRYFTMIGLNFYSFALPEKRIRRYISSGLNYLIRDILRIFVNENEIDDIIQSYNLYEPIFKEIERILDLHKKLVKNVAQKLYLKNKIK